MTLTEAKHLSPQQLAKRLLGAAGASGDFREAIVGGNGGLMIGMPGLNDVDLYRVPKSAGFAGLCQVEGVHIVFSTSRYDTPGDPPHRVTDFWKETRFAMMTPTAERVGNTDWKREDRECATLAPIANHADPVFFAVSTDKPVDAYFAMRTLTKAQHAAPTLGTSIQCRSYDKNWPICVDRLKAVTDIPIRQIHFVKVERCIDRAGWCVIATWTKSRNGNESRDVELTVRTDAVAIDPPSDFDVTGLTISAGTSVDD